MNWDKVRRQRGHQTRTTRDVEAERQGGYLIAARFEGRCVICGGSVAVGDPVIFVRGRGVWHPNGCPTPKANR